MIEYDTQQVCENGHQITSHYEAFYEERKSFCEECGAPTLTQCQECKQEIQGSLYTESRRKTLEDIVSVPKYCQHCGKSFPWTKKKITAAIQTLADFGDLDEQEKETIEQDVENISKDVPETELSARRISRILKRCGGVGYEIIMEFASRTAAKVLKGPYP